MFEIVRYESRRRVRGSAVLTAGLAVFALLVVALFPSIKEAGASFEAYIENLPPAFREGFVGTSAITTVEGFLSTEFYQFVWLLLLGLYMAYAAGGTVARGVETGSLDLVLATPVSRSRVVAEKAVSLLVPVVVLNLVTPLVVYGGLLAIDETIDFGRLLAVHALSVPYLLVCAGIGLVLSVLFDRADIAQRGGIGAVFMLFLLDTVTTSSDFEWLGTLSPTRYFEPTEILVDGTYDVGGALLLLAAAVALLLASELLFQNKDIS